MIRERHDRAKASGHVISLVNNPTTGDSIGDDDTTAVTTYVSKRSWVDRVCSDSGDVRTLCATTKRTIRKKYILTFCFVIISLDIPFLISRFTSYQHHCYFLPTGINHLRSTMMIDLGNHVFRMILGVS